MADSRQSVLTVYGCDAGHRSLDCHKTRGHAICVVCATYPKTYGNIARPTRVVPLDAACEVLEREYQAQDGENPAHPADILRREFEES